MTVFVCQYMYHSVCLIVHAIVVCISTCHYVYHSIILYVLVHVNMCIVVCVSMRQRASSLSFRCQVQGRKEEPSSEAPGVDKLVD